MLGAVGVFLACHRQAFISSAKTLCRTPLATVMTLIVIAIALTLPALFWVLTSNVKHLTSSWQQGGHISLYLHVPLAEPEEQALLARVRRTNGVAVASFKSAADGLAELQQQEGMEDLMQYLPENPLPAVIDVTPTEKMNSPEKMAQLFGQLKAYAHVEQAKLDMQWIARLHIILRFVTLLMQALMLLLGFAVVMIIGNTLRLAVHKRHEEVQVLKLIGATDAFIVRPFLYSGLWYGLGGALGACLLIQLFLWSLTPVLQQLLMLYQVSYPALGLSFLQALVLMGVAMGLGWLGARLSVKRQLALIEPYE